jgi:hypothetical protein
MVPLILRGRASNARRVNVHIDYRIHSLAMPFFALINPGNEQVYALLKVKMNIRI